MKRINSYLSFNGNCREAMNFYKDCLGGKLILQTIGESPLAGKMPEQMKESILHASPIHENVILMGTDMVSGKGVVRGNAVSLLLQCGSEEETTPGYYISRKMP